MDSPALFSSIRQDWATPRWLFERLDAEFGFTLDPCASPENATCPRFYTREDDGLSRPWQGSVFVNPPYGRELGRWIEKACRSAQEGATVVCLLPARTDTAWFHRWVLPHASELRFFRGRIRFAGGRHSAPFPSILVVFRPADPQGSGTASLPVTGMPAAPLARRVSGDDESRRSIAGLPAALRGHPDPEASGPVRCTNPGAVTTGRWTSVFCHPCRDLHARLHERHGHAVPHHLISSLCL